MQLTFIEISCECNYFYLLLSVLSVHQLITRMIFNATILCGPYIIQLGKFCSIITFGCLRTPRNGTVHHATAVSPTWNIFNLERENTFCRPSWEV